MPDIGSYADQSELPPPGSAGSNPEDYNPTTTSPDDGTTFTSPLNTSGGGGGSTSLNVGGLGNALSNAIGVTPQQLAAFGGAAQMYNNAGEFTTQSQKDAAYLDPAQQFQTGYGQQLQALEKDPSSVANTPGYQFALQQGLGAVGRADMAKGGAVPNSDDIAFASGLASQTYNSQVAQLTQLSGANFSPQSAASILQTGMLGNIGAQTAAMNDMFAGAFPPNNGNPNGSPTGSPTGAPVTFTPPGTSIPTPTSSPGTFTIPGAGAPSTPNDVGPPPPDYTQFQDNGGSAFDPSMWNSMSS